MLVTFLVYGDCAGLLEVQQVDNEDGLGVLVRLGPTENVVKVTDRFDVAARGRQVGVVLDVLPQVKQLSGKIYYQALF